MLFDTASLTMIHRGLIHVEYSVWCYFHLLTCLLAYSMEQSPPWQANPFSASQEITRILWNPKVYEDILQCPPPVLILSQIDPVHAPLHPTSWRSILILSSHVHLGLPIYLFSSLFPPPNHVNASPLPPSALHAPPISFFWIWSPELCLVRSTDHEASQYVVFSTSLLPRPS